ncbi:MAG: alpha/beta fold hydrolase [Calditrichaeota bacterium]|nr:MAG: alpha/beta fold hydrolase [Calditrichota bacterium]
MRQISRMFNTILLFWTFAVVAHSQTSAPAAITITRGGVLLKGKLYISEGEGKFPTVILLHGLPGNEIDVLGLGAKLSEAGINVVTFNYSGTYKSQGQNNFENTQKDIQAAFQFVHQPENISKYKVDTTRIYLGGWSYGGGMALTYTANHPEISDVFSIAGTDHGEFFREYRRNPGFKQMIDTMFEQLAAPSGPVRFPKGEMPKDVTEQMIADGDSTIDLRKSAPLLAQKNILLVGAWDDVMVTMDHHILPLYRTLKKYQAQNVKIVTFQDNHAFTQSRAGLVRTIINWIEAITLEK